MSVYLGTQLLSGVATNTISNAHNLFDFKWADHELDDQSWLNADTFSWQDGTVYSDAFNHLVADYNNGELHTETVGSYTIDYILAPDGHKIVTQYNEATVANIYDETGVAWYYVLDRVDDRFKLPRTKYGFNGLRDEVGNYIAAGLPNITGSVTAIRTSGGSGGSGALYKTKTSSYAYSGYSDSGGSDKVTISLNAQNSNPIYGNSTTVQPPATQMYLYFYVGQFSQSATEQTAGLNSELFNGKVDLDAQNLSNAGKSLISGLGMPSDTYDDLTLGASGSSYTAPANGWVLFCKRLGANTAQYISVYTDSFDFVTTIKGDSGNEMTAICPVLKGDTFRVSYNATGATTRFRFIYAEGDKNV